MYYKLNPHIALRGWIGNPFSYINFQNDIVYKLNEDELKMLNLCNGKNDIKKDKIISTLLKEKIICSCEKNNDIKNWQKYKFCANNCFSSVYWSITGKCNYSCRHCFMASDDSNKVITEFDFKECINFLNNCQKCGIYNIILTGGEPFLHSNFIDIIYECNKRHIKIKEILTNGSLITGEILDKILQTKIDPLIKISFDGLGHHDWMRNNKGAEERTLKAIKLLKNKGFKVCVQMNLHKGNINSIYPTAKLLDNMKVDKLRVIRTCESPRWEKFNDGKILSVEEYYNIGLDFSKKYLENKHLMPIEIWKFLIFYPKQKKYKLIPILNNGDKFNEIPICSEMRFGINVLSSGEIIPCNRMAGYFQKYNINFGNVKKDDFQQILLDSNYFNFVNKTVQDILDVNLKCKNCEFKNLCYAGCRAASVVFCGDSNSADLSKCIYFKKGYVEKTNQIFLKTNFKK